MSVEEETSKRYNYYHCQSQDPVPIGQNRISYLDFIELWDEFLASVPNRVTKEIIINDTSDTFPIYKFVITPKDFKKTIFLVAGMHGNEYEAYWGLLRLMKELYKDEQRNITLNQLRDNVRFIIIPVLNPYGMQNDLRRNSQGIDANYNYDLDRNVYTIFSGPYAFSSNEPKAVKLVCDEYEGEIDAHIEYHTDPYHGDEKYNYLESEPQCPAYAVAYKLTLDERDWIKKEYKKIADPGFVIWENNACTIFRYMWQKRGIPSLVCESGTNGVAASGTSTLMKSTVDFYMNTLIALAYELCFDNIDLSNK